MCDSTWRSTCVREVEVDAFEVGASAFVALTVIYHCVSACCGGGGDAVSMCCRCRWIAAWSHRDATASVSSPVAAAWPATRRCHFALCCAPAISSSACEPSQLLKCTLICERPQVWRLWQPLHPNLLALPPDAVCTMPQISTYDRGIVAGAG